MILNCEEMKIYILVIFVLAELADYRATVGYCKILLIYLFILQHQGEEADLE